MIQIDTPENHPKTHIPTRMLSSCIPKGRRKDVRVKWHGWLLDSAFTPNAWKEQGHQKKKHGM